MRDVRCNYRDVTGPALTSARVQTNWPVLPLLGTMHAFGHVIRKGQAGG
ncbi:MAG: hypothetical protein IT198_14510 [Acidimicrobiia bacterium]|nr:hypothetical protein [Acidimicrobiia bacterium]